MRKLANGAELHLDEMLGAIEKSSFRELDQSIKANDSARFATAYRGMMASCYGCHVAAEKPYLRLHLPQHPPENLIDFAPPAETKP